jgi:hypothetical protein
MAYPCFSNMQGVRPVCLNVDWIPERNMHVYCWRQEFLFELAPRGKS